MAKKVTTIDIVFSIDGIGTIICLPKEDFWCISPSEKIYRRERIEIRTPNGHSLSTFIKDIKMINPSFLGQALKEHKIRGVSPKALQNRQTFAKVLI